MQVGTVLLLHPRREPFGVAAKPWLRRCVSSFLKSSARVVALADARPRVAGSTLALKATGSNAASRAHECVHEAIPHCWPRARAERTLLRHLLAWNNASQSVARLFRDASRWCVRASTPILRRWQHRGVVGSPDLSWNLQYDKCAHDLCRSSGLGVA